MNFYTIVLIIAICLLILVLTGLGLMLTKVGTTKTFPPIVNTCPDGWTSDTTNKDKCNSDGKNIPVTEITYKNSKNVEVTTPYPVGDNTWSKNSTGYINYYYSNGNFAGGVTGESRAGADLSLFINKGIVKDVCDQKTWADANGIIWDGVTNSNAKC